MKVTVGHALMALALVGTAVAAGAYEIGSKSRAKQTWDLHETMTALAVECSNNGAVRPSNCIEGWDAVKHPIRRRTVKSQHDKTSPVEDASRWSDDPTRQLDRTPSSAHWGAAMLDRCRRIMTEDNFIDNVGLACSSHFGRLQIWHAMASEPGQSLDETRRQILAWAKFAYLAATDTQFRQSDYCETVAALGSENAVREALTFSNKYLCKERPGGAFKRRQPAWRVATLFGMSCRNPLSTRLGCIDLSVEDDERARIAAVGALLHMVQDSYSQAHVGRRNPDEPLLSNDGPFWNRIVCRPAERFYDYAAQNRAGPDVHSQADQPPVIDRSCLSSNRQVDDVITASAHVLWFTDKQDQERTPEKFVEYLERRVFPAS